VQQELVSLIANHIKEDGELTTPIPGLKLYRESAMTVGQPAVVSPALVIVAQGAKRVLLAGEAYIYDPDHYLVISLNLPLSGNVVKASRNLPYLALRLELDVDHIVSLSVAGKLKQWKKPVSERGLFISRMTPDLLEAVIRMLRLLKCPRDVEFLAPLVRQEILYRLLCGEHGAQLERIAQINGLTHRISKATDWLRKNFDRPFSVDRVAHEANMSASGLYQHFKTLTGMSPLQYQKQIRLQEARRLILADAMDVSATAYRVGYVSASQFSREYSRLFGAPPLKDMEHFRRLSPSLEIEQMP
jgi:AraC-like DNA-binding protein